MFLSWLWILVSLAIGAASVDTDKYKKLGGDAVLSPSSVPNPITSITWKHGAHIAVEWYGQETVAYREFKGRCKLDFNTGALTISNLTVKDSGTYTAEINNRVMSPTEITVISAVPKPTVSTQCISEGTRCTFTCEANVTGTEPVTYSWMVDGKNITGSSKSLQKERNDPEMVGKPIRCQLKNPVSSARSDDVIPFPNSDDVGAIVGGVAGILVFLIGVAVGLVICYRRRRRSQNLNEDVSPCFACFSKRSSQRSETSGGPQQQTSGDAQDRVDETTPFISQNNGFVQHEAHGQEQAPEAAQTGNGDEPSGRSQDDTPGQTEGAEEPSGRSQDGTPVQTEEGAEEPSGRSQDKADEEEAQISMSNGTAVAYTTVDETQNQEQNSESKQSKHEAEPSGRSQDGTPVQTEEGAEEPSGRSQDKADEEEAQISMSNGTVAFTTVDEIHNQEQNSESTQSKHGPEPSGRSQDDTPGQTEEGAEDTSEEGTPEL